MIRSAPRAYPGLLGLLLLASLVACATTRGAGPAAELRGRGLAQAPASPAAGASLDPQGEELAKIADAHVEPRGSSLLVTFPGDVLFDTGSGALAPGAYGRLDQIAATLARHPGTQILVKGHTDGVGAEAANAALSVERADAVRRYLIGKGVAPSRIESFGFGESQPVASNETAEGRRQNRRVEIELRASPAPSAPASGG